MSNGVDKESKLLNVVVVGREIAGKEIEGAQHKMSNLQRKAIHVLISVLFY